MKKDFTAERKQTRGRPSWYLMNFLKNMARAARLMHACIRLMHADEMLIEEAKRNYLISMVSALETFYHDLSVFVMESDEALLKTVLAGIKEKQSLDDAYAFTKKGVTFAEQAASKNSFQTIEEIEATIGQLFPPKGYLAALEVYEHVCAIPSRGAGLARLSLADGWRRDFGDVFTNRHALVHDANLACQVPGKQMARLETLVLQIAQVTSALIDKRYKNPCLTISGVPVVFLIEDLIRDDWEVVDDDRTGISLTPRDTLIEGGNEAEATDL